MTKAENVWDYLRMIYSNLQDQGINYVSVAPNFFDGSQQILLPEEVVTNGGGNCIDGSLLFAALLENMGVRPVINLIPGHAIISVESGPATTGNLWPLETTQMGTGAVWSEAMFSAIDTLSGTDPSEIESVYIDDARAKGLTPMP